jgi:peptide/nickel transport system substrate-binding protein
MPESVAFRHTRCLPGPERFRLRAAIALLALVLSTTYAQEPREGGTLIIGFSGEPTQLDVLTTSLATTRITDLICENLVGEDTRVEGTVAPIVPQLAEGWDISEDGLVYTFRLRRGITFTDGTPFDAEAVKLNFDRIIDPESPVYAEDVTGRPAAAGRIRLVESYRAIDDATFEVTLQEPFAPFINNLKHRNFGIISPASLMEHSRTMDGDNLVCTGPFMFSSRERGTSVVLTQNPDYWNQDAEGPYLDEIIFAIMPDVSARIAALQTGQIDIELELPADRVEELDRDPNIEVAFPGNPHVWFWMVNHRQPALQDLRVRQAIWHAMDVEGMIGSLYGDTAVALDTFLPPGNPAYRSDYERPYGFDPERARELLEEAGYQEGELTLTLGYPTSGASYMDGAAMAQWTQSNLRAVGVNANLVPFEWSAWISYLGPGLDDTIDLGVSAWQSIADHPYMLEQLFSTAAQKPAGSNNTWYGNPEFDDLLERARRAVDLDEQLRLYHEAEDVFLRDVGSIPIAHDRQPRAFRSSVQGLVFGPSSWFELTPVWLGD